MSTSSVWAPHERQAPVDDESNDANVVPFPTTDTGADARERYERLLKFCAEHGDPSDEIEFLAPDDYMAGFVGRSNLQGRAS